MNKIERMAAEGLDATEKTELLKRNDAAIKRIKCRIIEYSNRQIIEKIKEAAK